MAFVQRVICDHCSNEVAFEQAVCIVDARFLPGRPPDNRRRTEVVIFVGGVERLRGPRFDFCRPQCFTDYVAAKMAKTVKGERGDAIVAAEGGS